MTKIITITDYTVHSLTDGDKIALEAEAMRNTQRRIDERKARLAAMTEEGGFSPTDMARDLLAVIMVTFGCLGIFALASLVVLHWAKGGF